MKCGKCKKEMERIINTISINPKKEYIEWVCECGYEEKFEPKW
jgi:hypothetical protein